jgi:hypothetical protein
MIEEHYDYQKLVKVIDKQYEERDLIKQREAIRKEFDIDDDIPAELFHCPTEGKDYRPRVVFKIEEPDWNTGQTFRYWKSKCKDCGQWNKRFITQKYKDPFYLQSTTIRKDKSNNYKDLIQPEEKGYTMLYGHK